MKLLILIVALLPTLLFSQITINVADFSDGGD